MYNFNPYGPYYGPQFTMSTGNYNVVPQPTQQLPQQEIHPPKVHGLEGAKNLGFHNPNSELLALDDSAALLYLITTDAGGYATISTWDLSEHKEAPAAKSGPTIEDVVKRLDRLESKIGGMNNGKSGSRQN